ncbi:hypothetical protein ACM66B_005086 [Microbotryomycetes sp. NB124-2]
MAALPSPSKKPSLEAQDSAAHIDTCTIGSDDVRGSFKRASSSGWDDQIRQSALKARFAVSNGFSSVPRRGVGLAATRSEPVLSFSNGPPSTGHAFQTSNDTLQAVFGQEYRARELQPMWETSSTASSDAHSRSASFVIAHSGGGAGRDFTRETSLTGASASFDNDDQDMDGFDPDEAFGTSSSSTRFAFPTSSNAANDDSQGSATTRGTTRTITSRLNKRTFEDDPVAATQDDDDDEEMALTDVEDGNDEVQDAVPKMSFNAPIGRTLAGRRGLSKTQSLPAEVFRGEMSF